MAKFSEDMQHSRIAKLLNRLQGDNADHEAPAEAEPALESGADQAITEDEIVAQTVTVDASPANATTAETATVDMAAFIPVVPHIAGDPDQEMEQDSETLWEDALHTVPLPKRPLYRHLPTTARIGVLSLVAFAMWWTWPRQDDPSAWVNDARAGDVVSLAVINPANVEQGGVIARAATPMPDATAQAAQFNNIVVVTPTSTQSSVDAGESAPVDNEPLVLEASALVTGASSSAIVVEIPEAVPVESLVPALESEPVDAAQQDEPIEIILIPTATPSPTAQSVAAVDLNSIPKVEIVPAVGAHTSPTPEASAPTPTATEAPTATPPPSGPGRLWSTFTPLPAAQSDHFWIINPFENSSANRFASPSYQFGSTAGNRYRPHHGIDLSNPSGTPVKAGVTGTVIHAGPDDTVLLGPYNNFYGKPVVIRLDQQLPVAGGQLDVFVLYGHLSEVTVEVGQRVQPNDIVGLVGMTGIAVGPHLHIEIRLGANTYDHSVNPYLWVKPAEGNGAVAVRVLTANGRTWAGAKVSIARFEGGRAVWGRQIETYLDTENIGPDPLWGENGAMGDVPAGNYTLIANINGENIRTDFVVNAGETTFVELRTEQ